MLKPFPAQVPSPFRSSVSSEDDLSSAVFLFWSLFLIAEIPDSLLLVKGFGRVEVSVCSVLYHRTLGTHIL